MEQATDTFWTRLRKRWRDIFCAQSRPLTDLEFNLQEELTAANHLIKQLRIELDSVKGEQQINERHLAAEVKVHDLLRMQIESYLEDEARRHALHDLWRRQQGGV
jgi:hypothetical protein